jgi:hypothetical protein
MLSYSNSPGNSRDSSPNFDEHDSNLRKDREVQQADHHEIDLTNFVTMSSEFSLTLHGLPFEEHRLSGHRCNHRRLERLRY